MVHCFDRWGREESGREWKPNLAWGKPQRHGPLLLSASVVWAEQCLTRDSSGLGHGWAGHFLFGHGCDAGGIILRPGAGTKIACGNSADAGGDCHRFCASTEATDPGEGEVCGGSWAPRDVHAYLHRLAKHGALGGYNEFLLDGEWWEAHLPDTIEAFIAGTEGANAVEAQRLHADFLRTYGLTARDVPLLAGTCDCAAPYEEATSVAYDPCAAGRFAPNI